MRVKQLTKFPGASATAPVSGRTPEKPGEAGIDGLVGKCVTFPSLEEIRMPRRGTR